MRIQLPLFDFEVELHDTNYEQWIDCDVRVDTRAFRGSFSCTSQEADWAYLRQVLTKMSENVGAIETYKWETIEGNIAFVFDTSCRGTFTVEHRLRPSPLDTMLLSGICEADQSYIPKWIDSLNESLQPTYSFPSCTWERTCLSKLCFDDLKTRREHCEVQLRNTIALPNATW